MRNVVEIFAIVLVVFALAVNGRVFYLSSPEVDRYAEQPYPIPGEQSSRDLDLNFSAGDASEIDNNVRPVKKVYTVAAPEKPFIEVHREELPIARYKLVEAPVNRAGSDDVIVVPEPNRKTVKIDGNNKGEVILELRVIANHDTV